MTCNYKISLSTCHGIQITHCMSQISIALIIEFVKTVNRELNKYTSFASKVPNGRNIVTYNSLVTLMPEKACRILRYGLLYTTRTFKRDGLLCCEHKKL